MLDIDTSSFTEDNESLKLSLQQADKDFFLFCKFKDTFKWRVPIDFSQYSNFLDKDNITVLLSNRTKNVAGFKDVDGATRTCLVQLANTVPMITLDKIRHFMLSYHLQRIFVLELFELNQLNDPTSGHGLFLKIFLILGYDSLSPFLTMDAEAAKILLTSFAQHKAFLQRCGIVILSLYKHLLFDLFKHTTARAHGVVDYKASSGDSVDPYTFLRTQCTGAHYREYRKQHCMDNGTPTVISWAHYHSVDEVYCQDIVSNFDDYDTMRP